MIVFLGRAGHCFVGKLNHQEGPVDDNSLPETGQRIFPQIHKERMTSPSILSLKHHFLVTSKRKQPGGAAAAVGREGC